VVDRAISVEGLTCTFGSIRAVDGLSFQVPAGIVFGFLGPNGSGKTTTIRLLLGLLEPTSGHAEVLGYDTRTQAAEIRRRTGALLEHPGLYERLSVEDNLEFYGRVWRIPRPERHARIHELLTHIGLWDRRKEIVDKWSRGMKQKLAVARALLNRPSLVFLDEPTSGLDPVAAAALREDLANLAKHEGVTIFLTTHNLAEAERVCQQVAVIRQGRIRAIGPPDELRARAAPPRAKIIGKGFTTALLDEIRARPDVSDVSVHNGSMSIDLRSHVKLAPIVSLIVSAGAEVEEIQRSQASLEDAFLSLVEGQS
jgi:ABC-2 type transport system ATP-binding protein